MTDSTVITDRKEAAAILKNAKTFLEDRGWCQFVGFDSEGHRCIIGAMGAVGKESPYSQYMQALHTLVNLIEEKPLEFDNPSGASPIVAWNDAAGRTVEEVYDLLDRAAYKLETM